MEESKKTGTISVLGAASLGVGSMVGAGIFALLGEAGAIAGTATYLSFLIGGIVALSSGYSYAKLGSKFPSSGGVIEYLFRGFGKNTLSASFSVLFLIASIISMSMVSKTFGSYARSLITVEPSKLLENGFTSLIVIIFVGLNFVGSKVVSKAESVIVIIKLIILLTFMVAGLDYVNWNEFSTTGYPAATNIFGSLAITYFAYTGFSVITNTAGDMANPSKQLPKAIFLAIGFTIILYVGLSLVVFGNLSVSDVIKYKETALAEAAMPIFGTIGFVVISIAALLSTSSSLNANMFSVLNMSKQESQEGEISVLFMRKIWKQGTDGLLIIAIIILLMANFLDLTAIASLGSIATLLVTMTVHIGHYKIINETKASKAGVLFAIFSNLAAVVLFFAYIIKQGQTTTLVMISVLLLFCFLFERFYLKKKIQ
ncbi:APC family permease [Flavobacterium sp. 7A]|uniref:APC family permease n=1 Tax=Flavobacterium sp. 7A TaxID=2940571 RepID=UPI00222666BA|nr:APC family permease [Flavobacterium sp. 7A]MCW2120382.1 amino acid transporter [Flavobacterium sp. 7A]